MEGFVWAFNTRDILMVVVPFFFLHVLVTFTIERPDYLGLFVAYFWRKAFGRPYPAAPSGELPSGLVIIPSLLRDADDFNAITTTLDSCANNGYTSELVIVASVDGRTELPKLYAELCAWIQTRTFAPNVRVYATGTEIRLGKMMAVEAGVLFVQSLVAEGKLSAFPQVYFSIDGDGILGPHALERLAARLASRHWLTKNQRRIVSGKLAIRHDRIWQGWRAFFTVEGQLCQQVAREFVVSNLMRFNRKLLPQIGVPGALYCCWSDMLVKAPYYMGFLRTVRWSHWAKWWLGFEPPKFSESKAPPSAEALTGASDDTCMAFLASIATWKNGKLSLDAPRTPLHALGRLFVSFWIERSHSYEPEARIYTFTPSTIKGLWVQRVRWNSSRFECAGRFARTFWFHWEIGFPTSLHLSLVLQNVGKVLLFYFVLPFACLGRGHFVLGFALGYGFHILSDVVYTAIAFAVERDVRRCWRSAMCLPLTPLYTIISSNLACAYGVTKDLLFFGNPTKFAPESTLIAGQTTRVALLFRVRRFFALVLRSAIYGDVPFGTFWFGWRETKWTPNGFEGWTTGKPARAILPLPTLASIRRALTWAPQVAAKTATTASVAQATAKPLSLVAEATPLAPTNMAPSTAANAAPAPHAASRASAAVHNIAPARASVIPPSKRAA